MSKAREIINLLEGKYSYVPIKKIGKPKLLNTYKVGAKVLSFPTDKGNVVLSISREGQATPYSGSMQGNDDTSWWWLALEDFAKKGILTKKLYRNVGFGQDSAYFYKG
jgi:hypothetical protein